MRRKEKGFGIVGLAAAIAIAALVAAGAGMTTIQIIRGTARNEDHAEVVRQVQNLGRWFNRDALMAENITAGDNPETGDDELLTIYWKDWESGDTYDIRYIFLDYADSLKQIKRNEVMRNKGGVVVKNTTSLMARNIYSSDLSQQDNTWILNVEAHSGPKQSVKEYKIVRRLQ
jgi:Tfp pilus assembly protein PilE